EQVRLGASAGCAAGAGPTFLAAGGAVRGRFRRRQDQDDGPNGDEQRDPAENHEQPDPAPTGLPLQFAAFQANVLVVGRGAGRHRSSAEVGRCPEYVARPEWIQAGRGAAGQYTRNRRPIGRIGAAMIPHVLAAILVALTGSVALAQWQKQEITTDADFR